MKDLAGIIAVSLSLGIPIVAILAVFIAKIKKNNNDREIRRLIIENHTDIETAHYLVEEPEEKQGTNPYPALRWGCVLIGLGLGAFTNYLLHIMPNGPQGIYFWVLLAFGCGLGLLCSFLIEYKLTKKGVETKDED